ncbi:MAG: phospholipase D-like domain-containing protein [Methylocystis sp.]|nr:phospholipase D-like domain-containing protein [Methylocystis sp.]
MRYVRRKHRVWRTARRKSSTRGALLAALAFFLIAPAPQPAGLLALEPTLAGVRVLYGPGPGFESVDVRLIDGATRSIDLAAYVLTDRALAGALGRAAMRGVTVRVYLDGEDMRAPSPIQQFAGAPNLEVRIKARGRDMMHLKSFQVDGRVLRSGSANFSVSAGAYQDNDIVVLESPLAAASFRAAFEKLWARPDNQRIGLR